MLSRFTLLMCVVGVLSAELHKVRILSFVIHWQKLYVKLMRKFKKIVKYRIYDTYISKIWKKETLEVQASQVKNRGFQWWWTKQKLKKEIKKIFIWTNHKRVRLFEPVLIRFFWWFEGTLKEIPGKKRGLLRLKDKDGQTVSSNSKGEPVNCFVLFVLCIFVRT